MIQKNSDKCPKIEEKLTKSSIKGFGKFRLFAIGCIFALFQCCTPKCSIGSDYALKPKKIAFLKLLFCPNLLFLSQHCFSPTLKQWQVTLYSP